MMSLLQALHLSPLPPQAAQPVPGSPPGKVVSRAGPGFGNNPHPAAPSKDDKSADDEWVPGNLVKTPYGRVHRYVDKTVANAEAFNKFAFNAVEDEITAREDGASLDKAMSGEKAVSAFVAKHLGSFEAEVMTNRSGNAKGIARDMEQQKQLIGVMVTSFQQLQLQLEQAKGHLSSAMKRIESLLDMEEARRLDARARNHEKNVNAASALVGAVIAGGVALGTGNPWGLLKPMWDASGAVAHLTQDNPHAKAADDKHREGTVKALEAANEDIDTAETVIAGAATVASSMQDQLKTAADSFAEMQSEAEGDYDKQTRGQFKFGVLAKHAGSETRSAWPVAWRNGPRARTSRPTACSRCIAPS
jgi:hypothetical protein